MLGAGWSREGREVQPQLVGPHGGRGGATGEKPKLFAGDEFLATAILNRLLHRAHVLNIRGRSYRLRDLEESLKP